MSSLNTERTLVHTSKLNRILVATDGGEASQHAVALGVELAAAEDAEVTCLHIAPPVAFVGGRLSMPALPRRMSGIGDDVLNEATFVANERGVRCQREVIAGDVGDSIVAFADAIDADLVVVGERPRRLRVGTSVSRWVTRNTARAVLVARAPAGERVAA